MKANDFINIKKEAEDLPDTNECWKLASYAEREKEILDFMKKKNGYMPSPNMVYIREVSFPVTKSIEMFQLQKLAGKIREKFVIDCFQICIDRSSNKARMLFDWYDRTERNCVYLYEARMFALATLIIQTLDLPVMYCDGRWLRYFLQEDYSHDPAIFDKIDDWIRHQHPCPKSYRVLKNALTYAKQRCMDLVR